MAMRDEPGHIDRGWGALSISTALTGIENNTPGTT
jgi:hypothetical protein